MMRRSVLIPMCLLVACSSPTAVRLGDTATLAPGQTARLEGYGIEVTFLAVPEDSRCSPNELILCLWEGDALVALRVSGPDGVAEFGVHTHRDFGSVASYGSFTIALDSLTPYPTSDGPPARNSYRVTLRFGSTLD